MRASNSYGISNGVTSIALPLVKVPEPMTNFAARSGKTTQILVTWSDQPNELGYTITRTERNLQGMVTTTFINLPKDSFQYVDRSITAGFTYTYQMVIFNSYGISRPTLLRTVVVPTPGPDPGIVPVPGPVEVMRTTRPQVDTVR